MDFELPPDDDPRREAVRSWLAHHPNPTGRELAEAGYVAPHWPRPWGLEADPLTQIVIDEELRRAGVARPSNPIGIGWAGPTIIAAGTPEQKERYLFPILSGEEIWCQLFSEPSAGSDLASLTTRAIPDADGFVVRGQKVWTTYAHEASFGILLARTDPEAPKHRGITYFICPMDSPGVTVRKIVDMTGMHSFNEVFLDEVRLSSEHVVGEVGQGWSLAKVTLANERVSLSSAGAIWGAGPTAYDLVEVVRKAGGVADPVMRQRVAAAYTRGRILELIRYRTVTAQVLGRAPGPEVSIRKVMADEHGQELMGLAKDLAGPAGMLLNSVPMEPAGSSLAMPDDPQGASVWGYGYLFSPALTIGGGTAQVQRNIIAEKVLGLPRDPETA
jgi:alkylation response protein AidB-like acyl-CoA dehydrogenase